MAEGGVIGEQQGLRREVIVAALRLWHATYGAVPTTADWEPSRARRAGELWRVERYDGGSWPSMAQVRAAFGTMTAAVEAAGLTPRQAPPQGRPARHWTEEAIIEAIQAWAELYGEPPTMGDWDVYRSRKGGHEWRVARYSSGAWPSARTVTLRFANFTNAIAAAGFTPRPQGSRRPIGAQRRLGGGPIAVRSTTLGYSAALSAHVRRVAEMQKSGSEDRLREALFGLARQAMAWGHALGAGEARADGAAAVA